MQTFASTTPDPRNTKRVLLAKWLTKVGGTPQAGDTRRILTRKIAKILKR